MSAKRVIDELVASVVVVATLGFIAVVLGGLVVWAVR